MRKWIKFFRELVLLVSLGCVTASFAGKEPWTKEARDAMTPREVVIALKEGNQRFRKQIFFSRDLTAERKATREGQWPAAVILGCIDSRAPSELIFDTGIGEIFNARIAGNFINVDLAGSLEFSCKVAGSKVVVVLGHSNCGAIKAACDGVKLGNITQMLSHLQPAVDFVEGFDGRRHSRNREFVKAVTLENIRLTTEKIREISPILREMEANGEIAIVGAFYDVKKGKVDFLF